MRLPVLALCLVVLCGACATPSTRVIRRKVESALSDVSELTALGDSVPHGSACNCTPYPQLTGAHHTSNDAVPGFTSTDVLHQTHADRRGDRPGLGDLSRRGLSYVPRTCIPAAR
jgi:hypothetical protein